MPRIFATIETQLLGVLVPTLHVSDLNSIEDLCTVFHRPQGEQQAPGDEGQHG